ncbi:uncharacterized protein LOC141661550 [Apium graveolens]|uniref:uncharacterized protein LOC141661550 n=1 Tax=Apium graveolens TaxID=4045 RepID=UPI003D7A5FAF
MISFKQSDLAELKDPHSYLSDVIIEFFFTYLSSIHPSDSILYVPPSISFLLSNSTDDGFVEDCLKSLELPSKNLIFFTVYRCKHWSLLVYHRESDRFVHHDSSSTRTNDAAARELYLSVKDCVHGNTQRIKPRTRRCMDGPRYVGWPEKNDYECGSCEFPWMRYMDGPSDDPRYVRPRMRPERNGCGRRSRRARRMQREISWIQMQRENEYDDDCGLDVGPQMWRETNDYDDSRLSDDYNRRSYRLPRTPREKNEYEDDCELYEGPQMLREKNDYDDSRFSDDKDCGLYDALDCGSSVRPPMRGEKNKYECGSSISSRMQPEKKGLFICPETPRQKNGFDCGLFVMAIAEAICRWFCEEGEEKSWIGKINEMVGDSLVSTMRTRVLELIRDASSGGLGTVSCTIEEEKSVGVCSNTCDASRGLDHDVVTIGENKEETCRGLDHDVVTIGENKEEIDEIVDFFWEDINWSTDEDDSGTISDGDDCQTISERLAELIVEEGENDCRTLSGSPPQSVAVGKIVANERDSAPLVEEETANGKVCTEVPSLAREEAVDESGIVEPSPSCDLTSVASCIVEENKPVGR